MAIAALMDAAQVPSPGLYEIAGIIAGRYAELGLRFQRSPSPPLDLGTLPGKTRTLPQPLAAIETSRDGDTEGWYVRLGAIGPAGTEHYLAAVSHSTGIRLFNGQVPPWPDADEAG